LKTILKLLLNDLKRDGKQPWTMLLFAALPLGMSLLIGGVFGGSGKKGSLPVLHLAVLDEDQDLLTGLLRSLPSQGDPAKQLRLHFVETKEEGLRVVEKRQASALIILPKGLTEGLLSGATNVIQLYENPAEQILPKVARQGTSLLALGLSGAAEVLGGPLRDVRRLIENRTVPSEDAITSVASDSYKKIRGLRTYLFPPVVQIKVVEAADFNPVITASLQDQTRP
jgi:hypothetical protein